MTHKRLSNNEIPDHMITDTNIKFLSIFNTMPDYKLVMKNDLIHIIRKEQSNVQTY
jgi:hypothetical protein